MYKPHLQKIIEAHNDNKLVFFIGAGMSLGSGLPSWSALIGGLKKELNTNETDYLKVAQLYFLEFGEYEYYKKIKNYFPLEKVHPQRKHKLLIQLRPQYIITTNWDDIIEKAIDEEMSLYDCVRNENELISAISTKKLIKMHGDIALENIIFKEDDYLEYSHKFPLIENYIKSILSTNVVVFLGYSYSDINLKFITKWLQNNSSIRPPSYMIVFEDDKVQEKYFKNHGISVLNIANEYDDNDKSRQVELFLQDIIDSQKIRINESNPHEFIDTIDELLRPLDQFEIILIDQLKRLCKQQSLDINISFDDSSNVIIRLNKYYDLIDRLFKEFRTLFPKNRRKEYIGKINHIIAILHKTGINGIAISHNQYHVVKNTKFERYYQLKEWNFNYKLNCDKTIENAYYLVQYGHYKAAYLLFREIVQSSRKENNYIDMFKSMYNANIALLLGKADYTHDNQFDDAQAYDLDEIYFELKKSIQKIFDPILFIFRDFSFIYKNINEIKEFGDKKESQKKIIKNGGMSFSSDNTKAKQIHKNLLYFVNNNYICIDIYSEFKNLQREFIKVSLLQQFRNEQKTLEYFELFTCVKYLDEKVLKELFAHFYAKDSEEYKKFNLEEEKQNYLIGILDELLSSIDNSTDVLEVSRFEQYWINTLYLLSICKCEKIDVLHDNFKSILLNAKGSISIYESINLFWQTQKYIFENKVESQKLFELLEITINKLLSSQYNFYDLHALENNTLFNYLLEDKDDQRYTNLTLIQSLLSMLKSFDSTQQIKIAMYFLQSIYSISDDNIRTAIRDYILQLDTASVSKENALTFKLLMLIRGFITVNDFEFENEISIYLDTYRDGKTFSYFTYRLREMLTYLKEEKNISQFTSILDEINEMINNYEKNKKPW